VDATTFISGLLFSLSLIVAIGPQNAFVLQQGARREYVTIVVLICTASDALLIAAGVAGIGSVVGTSRGLLMVTRFGGATLLLAYGCFAARRALVGPPGQLAASRLGSSRGRVLAATLGFTWLNPGVYLDTVVLLGSVANAHPSARWSFGAGAATASACWFIGLGWAARLLTPLLCRPNASRLLDGFVAVVMAITALRTLPV
jgi:L-lysine exporter family protein LysE/ArgO